MNGFIVLAIYTAIMLGATLLFTKRERGDAESFHVGTRREGTVKSALSIAATWIWAPALFVSAERAYVNGWPGLFWFLVPNALCLIIFIPFAKRIRAKMPNGITLSSYMGEHYQSQKVRKLYQFQLSGLAVFSTAVQLLAGSKMLALTTGLPFWALTLILAAVAYSYSWFSGIKASMLTDAVQMVFMLAASVAFMLCTVSTVGVSELAAGVFSASGNYHSLFDGNGITLLLGFGLPTTIGLLSGPFGDQSFWQRAFAVKSNGVGRAFSLGALFFTIVPLAMGLIGFTAAGSGFVPNSTGTVNLEFITKLFPAWTIVPFLFMIISGLLSTVDSNLCAAASLTTDSRGDRVTSKAAMLGLLAASIAIANIPGLTVTHLFLFYGTFRASTLLPTVFTLRGAKLTAHGVFIGVILSLVIGLPIFAYGNIANIATVKTIGSLVTVLTSGVVALIAMRLDRKAVRI
jgi:Na+/proline symporter